MSIAAERSTVMLDAVTPIWRRIADDLQAGISSGRYKVGDRLPSIPELARKYAPENGPDLNRNHVQEAMRWLVATGLAEARTGSGHTVVSLETWEERARACEDRERSE